MNEERKHVSGRKLVGCKPYHALVDIHLHQDARAVRLSPNDYAIKNIYILSSIIGVLPQSQLPLGVASAFGTDRTTRRMRPQLLESSGSPLLHLFA